MSRSIERMMKAREKRQSSASTWKTVVDGMPVELSEQEITVLKRELGVQTLHELSEAIRAWKVNAETEASRLRAESLLISEADLVGDSQNQRTPPVPSISPKLGERLLLLILRTKEERANIPGDLEEEFKQIAAKHGARFAKLWYYKQVAASAWQMIRKAACLGLLTWVAEWIRRRV